MTKPLVGDLVDALEGLLRVPDSPQTEEGWEHVYFSREVAKKAIARAAAERKPTTFTPHALAQVMALLRDRRERETATFASASLPEPYKTASTVTLTREQLQGFSNRYKELLAVISILAGVEPERFTMMHALALLERHMAPPPAPPAE